MEYLLLNKSFKSWWTDFREDFFILDNEIVMKIGAFIIVVSNIFFCSLIKSIGFILEIPSCDISCLMRLFFLDRTLNLRPTLTCISAVLGS